MSALVCHFLYLPIFRRKFSVRAFTADLLKYKCNSFQYIGELCRYLVNAAPCADDAKLEIEYAIGNGMRPDIWDKFQVPFCVLYCSISASIPVVAKYMSSHNCG